MAAQARLAVHNCSENDRKLGSCVLKATNGKKQTIFSHMLTSKVLDPSDKVVDRMAQEGFSVISAGAETTGRVLTVATFCLLESRDFFLQKLQEELASNIPEAVARPSLKDLENLPWLASIDAPYISKPTS